MTQQPKVVTRFAPSPTGFLHIGGARTALFNWLFAKHYGGKMLLRIEDTDRVRATPGAVEAIIDGLNWLGLDWEGDPISQFARIDRHKEVAHQMLASGKAYRCHCSPEEVEAMRTKSRQYGLPFRHRCACRDRDQQVQDASQDHNHHDADADAVIRLKVADHGETVVDDMVKGRYAVPNKELDDFVLLRSDGTPTYMLAVVVDDHDMGVTHIIRGVEHQTNAAKQTLIYQALDWSVPAMAHIPLIHGPDGAKMSKRHGATGAHAYRAMGYLPQTMRNYLARLGWSHGDDEIILLDDMIRWFGLDAVGQSASRFDFRKINNLNGHYIRAMDDNELLYHWKVCLADQDQGDAVLDWLSIPDNERIMLQALPGIKQRAKTLLDLTEGASYLWRKRPLDVDAKAAKLLDADGARAVLSALLDSLTNNCVHWDADSLETCIKSHADQTNLKLASLAQPLRAALTGRGVSRGIYDVLVDLGREESLARIKDQLLLVSS